MASSNRVHLDHFILRQSLRYVPGEMADSDLSLQLQQEDRSLRYDDIRRDEWFSKIRKPDFQRETNAWTPEDCVEFLDSVVNGRIIPSIILWRSQDNSLIYVLDGAHRLSVIRAWMTDDWGDKAGDYYSRRDQSSIVKAARETRLMVKRKIGLFVDFKKAYERQTEIVERGESPKKVMSARRFSQSSFYSRIAIANQTLPVQWERGNYESAEQSFLRINRSGQPLDPWEATLIEYRNSSYARSIMCIANGGDGHFWPEPKGGIPFGDDLCESVETFRKKAAGIYRRLFVPPFRLPIKNLNVPCMVAPAYFQKHKYLIEVIPLITERKIATTEKKQIEILERDVKESPEVIIRNGERILSSLEEGLEHIISPTHSSKSLSIIPLFYWYNRKARYARGLFYGFIYWILSGSDRDIIDRKLVFSANRDRFESVLFNLKREIATLQEKGGAGLYATKRVAGFFQEFLTLLHNNPDLSAESEELREQVIEILAERARLPRRSRKAKSSRSYSSRDKSQINARELFEHSIPCHICGGTVNLQQGLQYDHVIDYADSGLTDPETGKPTHPFCNRHKKTILRIRSGEQEADLPQFDAEEGKREDLLSLQLSLPNFWGEDNFPS